jgi:oligoendopeptidase F
MEVKLRNELSNEFKWDLTHLYKNLDEFNEDCFNVEKNIEVVKSFRGKLSDTKKLKECLDLTTNDTKILYKLYTYSQRYFDQEQNNEDADKLVQKVSDLSVKHSTASKFITDEVINFDQSVIDNILSDNELINYHFDIKDTLKNKNHILSEVEEKLLSKISDVFSTSSDVYTVFKNTELKYTKVKLSSGEEVEINDQNYRELRESSVRDDRKIAFDTFWQTYDDYKNTFAKLMQKFVKNSATNNNIRNYNSSLEASLSSEEIPIEVYDKLIFNISNNLNNFHDYLKFRKEQLDCEDMNYYDLYNPIVKNIDYKYTYEDAKELILKSTQVLGDEYVDIIKNAFNNSWIDVYPNKFKDTGAYMCGSAYDHHPYILMNYADKYDDVSTLAHELGHAAHSVYSNKNQTFNKAQYSTYIAEIASTTNEILLFNYMLKNTDDKQLKIFLLNNYIEHFRTTVFRQTMFAEFEKFMYETVEKDDVLTASTLTDKYHELLCKYHGVDQNVMSMNKLYANEWSFIPHFYYNFYVYQYATSFISSVIIATKILNGDEDQLNKYLELLKSGGSDYPVELLKKAGVDLTNDDTYKIAFDNFSKYLNELKELLTK